MEAGAGVEPEAEAAPTQRSHKPVSLPRGLLEDVEAFLERHKKVLGYRGLPEFIAEAIREKKERAAELVLRFRAADQGAEDLDWKEAPKKKRPQA